MQGQEDISVSEVRQAVQANEGQLRAVLLHLELNPHPGLVDAIVKNIVEKGANHRKCYCVRTVEAVAEILHVKAVEAGVIEIDD